MSAKKENDTLAALRALFWRTGVIFYMIPPSKTEGELDQRRLTGEMLSAQLSVLLWSCTGDLLGLAGSRWSFQVERTINIHKTGYGRWRQDFSPLQQEGRGKALAQGNQSNHCRNWSGRHMGGLAARSAQKVRPRVPCGLRPAPDNPGCALILCIKLCFDCWCSDFILSLEMQQKHSNNACTHKLKTLTQFYWKFVSM